MSAVNGGSGLDSKTARHALLSIEGLPLDWIIFASRTLPSRRMVKLTMVGAGWLWGRPFVLQACAMRPWTSSLYAPKRVPSMELGPTPTWPAPPGVLYIGLESA